MSGTAHGEGAIHTVPELLAHALAMETEAVERYGELADQMEMHHRAKVAAVFRRLERAEKKHLGELHEMCRNVELPHYAPWDFKWRGSESPEAIDIGKVHYLLSLREALQLALEHERMASNFYQDVAKNAENHEVRQLAREFADDELEHVGWLEISLAECGADDSMAAEDPDPPLGQE